MREWMNAICYVLCIQYMSVRLYGTGTAHFKRILIVQLILPSSQIKASALNPSQWITFKYATFLNKMFSSLLFPSSNSCLMAYACSIDVTNQQHWCEHKMKFTRYSVESNVANEPTNQSVHLCLSVYISTIWGICDRRYA